MARSVLDRRNDQNPEFADEQQGKLPAQPESLRVFRHERAGKSLPPTG